MFFKSKRNVREPDESVRLTSSIEALIWRQEAKDGQLDIRFGLNRIDAKGNVRRTFAPNQIGELVASLGALAVAIGQAPGIEAHLATELRELGAGIVLLLDKPKGNGLEAEESAPKRLFA